ncbi:M42 family metallopeptidase [Phycisphaerales bacterium AB-hyl4]|uniref:M42 family metallopeptidase n=1 Tax=Natronomicrosphaera hydrolytica TaxID=3242702 RepID=A0ABV4U398_9BACT
MELLKELVEAAAVPGREHRMRELVRERVASLVDEVRVDALGSVIAIRKPRPSKGKPAKQPTRVMLAAHMDQIGFLVKYVDERGFIRLNPVGGFDTRNLFARLVTVCPDLKDPAKDLPGVLNPAGKPIHIASDEDRKKVPDIEEFVVDLGLPGDEVRKQVKIGDMVVLRSALIEVGATAVSQCLDNRVACWIVLRALEQLEHHDCEVQAVFTVQEEVGLRGAGTAAYELQPDIGIAVDTTLCVDTPGVPNEQRVTEQGAGAGLTVMDSASIADVDVLDAFEQVAKKKKIKHQRSILARGGTDAGTMQRAGRGRRTMTLSCPTRYIHTVTEMVHLDDLYACRDLLAGYLEQV